MKRRNYYQWGVAPIVIILLVVTTIAVVTTVIIVGKGLLNPEPSSRPSEAQEKLPKNQSPTPAKISPSTTPKSSPSAAFADEKGVTVSTVFRSDNRALVVDFQTNSFNSISQIYYNLNYDTDEPGKIRGVEGKVIPSSDQITGSIKNKPYIRRELVFGVCSINLCRYDANPRNFKLTVVTTKTSSQTFTQVLYPKY